MTAPQPAIERVEAIRKVVGLGYRDGGAIEFLLAHIDTITAERDSLVLNLEAAHSNPNVAACAEAWTWGKYWQQKAHQFMVYDGDGWWDRPIVGAIEAQERAEAEAQRLREALRGTVAELHNSEHGGTHAGCIESLCVNARALLAAQPAPEETEKPPAP